MNCTSNSSPTYSFFTQFLAVPCSSHSSSKFLGVSYSSSQFFAVFCKALQFLQSLAVPCSFSQVLSVPCYFLQFLAAPRLLTVPLHKMKFYLTFHLYLTQNALLALSHNFICGLMIYSELSD